MHRSLLYISLSITFKMNYWAQTTLGLIWVTSGTHSPAKYVAQMSPRVSLSLIKFMPSVLRTDITYVNVC